MTRAHRRAPEGLFTRVFDALGHVTGRSRVQRRASFVWLLAEPPEGRLVGRLIAPAGVPVAPLIEASVTGPATLTGVMPEGAAVIRPGGGPYRGGTVLSAPRTLPGFPLGDAWERSLPAIESALASVRALSIAAWPFTVVERGRTLTVRCRGAGGELVQVAYGSRAREVHVHDDDGGYHADGTLFDLVFDAPDSLDADVGSDWSFD